METQISAMHARALWLGKDFTFTGICFYGGWKAELNWCCELSCAAHRVHYVRRLIVPELKQAPLRKRVSE